MKSIYIGNELELFSKANNWKSYWKRSISKYIGSNVLDVGAGIGSNLEYLWEKSAKWYCLEPDPTFIPKIIKVSENIEAKLYVTPFQGTLSDLKIENNSFDTIIYIDVLEHIKDDFRELELASKFLVPGGHLIVLSPAYQWLYSPFDAAVGHYRRYSKKTLAKLSPENLKIIKSEYLDSLGCIASLINKLFLQQSTPSSSQIYFWDKVIVNFSRILDKLVLNSFGRTIYFVWQKTNLKT